MKYAVQYRDMHTAIHHLVICHTKRRAEMILESLLVNHVMRDGDRFCMTEDIEINFRNVPDQYKGENMTVINQNIPNVF